MKTKKRIEINRFDFKNKDNEICYEKFYNYFPTKELYNSSGIEIANFQYESEDLRNYQLTMPEDVQSIKGLALYKQRLANFGDIHRLLIYADNKKVYLHQLLQGTNSIHWLYELTFENTPITLAYKIDDEDAIIITDGNQMKIWKTNFSPYTVQNAPIITDMCMNEGVLYCCLKEPAFKIWYATDLNPENVGGINKYSGYISLEDDLGNANRVVVLDENVYVIRDFGISKINYTQSEIVVSQVYSTNTKILSKTVSVCGNVLLFMTKEGLYSYNGTKVNKINMQINFAKDMDMKKITACSLADKYYLACRLDYNDENKILSENLEFVNNSLIILNITDNTFEILRGVDINAMLPVKTETYEKVLVISNLENSNKISEIVEKSSCFDENLPKYWISKNIFENFDVKLFTKLIVDADKDVVFKLMYDDKEISFTTYKSGLNEFVFKIMGKQLRLEISSNEINGAVKKVYLDYYDY